MRAIEVNAPPAKRLSVVAACIPRGVPWPGEYLFPIKRWAELLVSRAAISPEVEILLVEDTPGHPAITHVRENFSETIAEGALRVLPVTRTGDTAILWNRGAEAATGSWLHFVRPPDLGWVPDLPALLEKLPHHDWVARLAPGTEGDWASAILSGNPWERGSHAYRRTLYLECGRFPEGYRGTPRPKRFPGDAEFELAVRAGLHLSSRGEKDRARFPPASDGKGKPPALDPFAAASRGLEKLSLLRLFPRLPKERWLPWARGIATLNRKHRK